MTELLYGGQVEDDHILVSTAKDIDDLRLHLFQCSDDVAHTVVGHLTLIKREILCSNRGKFLAEDLPLLEPSIEWITIQCRQISVSKPGFKMAAIICRRCAESVAKLRKWEEDNFWRATPLMVPLNEDMQYLAHSIKIRPINITYLQKLTELFELYS